MDPQTVRFYAGNAADLARRYTATGSAAARYFPVAFTTGSRVLDVGCGSGRDLKALIDAGPPNSSSWKARARAVGGNSSCRPHSGAVAFRS